MKNEKLVFLLSIIFYIFIYFLFYPSFYSFVDERVYIIQAQRLLELKLNFPEWTSGFAIYEGRIGVTSRYPPYYSLLFLSIPLNFGLDYIFLVSLFIHIASSFLFYKILEIYKINPLFSIFYIFHPSFVLFSRTVMADFPSSFLFLLTFYLHLKQRYLFSYITFFLFSLLKPTNFLYSFIFIYDSLIKREYKNLIHYFILTFLSVSLIFIYIFFVYGRKHPGFDFSINYFWGNLRTYFFYLNINYPLLLIIGLLGIKKINNLKILLPSFLPSILVFLFYVYRYEIPENIILSSIAGLRFFLPFLTFLLIGYSKNFHMIFKDKLEKFFIVSVFPAFLIFTFVMMKKHNEYLLNFKETKDLVYRYTKEDDLLVTHLEVSKLLLPVWGKRENMHFTDFKKFTFYENLVKRKKDLPDSFLLVYSLKSAEKNLSFIKVYADSILKIFPKNYLLFHNDYLYIFRVYKNF
ncbi:MAG: hypothetical protein ABDH37_03365 [Candidatus Hydrothermales bacterium]